MDKVDEYLALERSKLHLSIESCKLEIERLDELINNNKNMNGCLEHYKKKLESEYYERIPRSFGVLKGWKKEKADRLRKERDELLEMFDKKIESLNTLPMVAER